jgi:hypothetical protein
MMLVASGLLWLNIRDRRTQETLDKRGRPTQWVVALGWPIPCYADHTVYALWSLQPDVTEPTQQMAVPSGEFQWSALAIDAALNGIFILVVTVGCESLARRIRAQTGLDCDVEVKTSA